MSQETTRAQELIDEMMGVKPRTPAPVCFVYGNLGWIHENHYDVELMRRGRTREVRFLHSMMPYVRDSASTALIEVPKGVVAALDLALFVLDDAEVAKYRARAEAFNAPYLPPTTTKKPELIGSVRI